MLGKSLRIFTAAVVLALATVGSAVAKELDYSDKNNWAYLETDVDKPVDVFLLCPTIEFVKPAANMDTRDAKLRARFVGTLNMERGIYDKRARMFAPFYQQANLAAYSLPKQAGDLYFDKGYQDVQNAFKYYLEHYNQGRPFILAGFSQGAWVGLELMRHNMLQGKYRQQLIGAYLIGWRLTSQDVAEHPDLKPAQRAYDTGVIITLNTEAPDIEDSILVPQGMKNYGINPLTWRTDSAYADKSLNLGACFVNKNGEIEKEIPHFTGGYLDSQRGTMKLPEVNKEEYPAVLFPNGVYHIYDYQFFYRNLQANVEQRIAAYLARQKQAGASFAG